jgi:hypothetical protein
MGSATSAPLTTWQVCHGCHVARMATFIAVLTASSTHLDHYAQPGQEKRSLRLSAEALSRSSEQIGRMVELQNDHRAYEDPLTMEQEVGGSSPPIAHRWALGQCPQTTQSSSERNGILVAVIIWNKRRVFSITRLRWIVGFHVAVADSESKLALRRRISSSRWRSVARSRSAM